MRPKFAANIMESRRYDVVVIGCSTGGLEALRIVLGALPATFPLPILVVCHTALGAEGLLVELLGRSCVLTVREAVEKQSIAPGVVVLASPGYHLLLEKDLTLSFSADLKVCGARPAIDVLFESAADAVGERLIGIVLTGANNDGSRGLLAIRQTGGVGIVQDPVTAVAPEMPQAALDIAGADYVFLLSEIAPFLMRLVEEG
ncbi:putative protein-glutamate methylesterase/protein-glutamine glutaminase [Azospirillaceae bacterium]